MADEKQHNVYRTHAVEPREQQTELTGQLPNVVEVEDLEAINDPVERRKRITLSISENVAPFSEPVFLMHDDRRTMYAVGWSRYDLLIDMIHDDGRILAKNDSLGSYTTHAPWFYNAINRDTLKQLRQNQPEIVLRQPDQLKSSAGDQQSNELDK